jgi:8-oxo-dGTP diphosphatase
VGRNIERRERAVEVCIAVGLLCRHGRLLLGKRSTHRRAYPGVWDLPGGHVEAGERIEQALVRELREELGVTPREWQELAVLRAPAVSNDGTDTLRLHVFLVTAWRGEPRNLALDEHDAIAWVTGDDATGLLLAHTAYPALFRRALEGAQ